MTGYNEYDYMFHDLRFKQDFSSANALSYIDHSFEAIGENTDANGLPIEYIYRRYDLTKANGRCYVEVYEPRGGIHNLPNDAEGKSGWISVGGFFISNRSLANNPMVITETYDRIMRSKYDKQGITSGPDLHKTVYNSGGSWDTRIDNPKIYKVDLNSSEVQSKMKPRKVQNAGRDVDIDPRTQNAALGINQKDYNNGN